MSAYAIINKETNIVENVIDWDGQNEWNPPIDTFIVSIENVLVNAGDSYSNGEFIKKPIEVIEIPQPTKEELLAKLQELTNQINALS